MRIVTAKDAAAVLLPFFEAGDGERVVVVHLGPEQRLLGVTLEASGTNDEIELPVRAIAAGALRLGAAAIILAHNHPSGDPTPSREDISETRRLAQILSSMAIRLADHIIFGAGAWRSFRAEGLV
jgi:DNA repair protein RadC